MNKYGKIIDDDCNCPKLDGKRRVSLYVIKNTSVSESTRKDKIYNALIDVFGYTRKQAETATSFVEHRGECFVYHGVEDAAVVYMETLQSMDVRCKISSDGNLK